MRCSRAILAVVLLLGGMAGAQPQPQKSTRPLEAPSATLPAEHLQQAQQPPIVLPSRNIPAAAKVEVPRIVLPPLSEAERQGIQNGPTFDKRTRVGVVRELQFSSTGQGVTAKLEDGKEVWMLEVVSTGAEAIRLHLKDFHLPDGAQLFISAGTGQEVTAFSGRGPLLNGEFWSPAFLGDTVRIELLHLGGRPAGFQVSDVGHIFAAKPELQIQSCHLDATCYSAWAQAADSVALIQFRDGTSFFACSAVLLNNNAHDFSPLLLTANHCISTEEVAQTVQAEWFYRTLNCNGDTGGTKSTLTATLLATNPASDATLLELLGPVPANVTYAGWSAATAVFGEALTSIHHPAKSYRRISFGSLLPDLPGYEDYHHVVYSSGMAEPGSSGGPLFNSTGQVIGQLRGGNASCANPGGDVIYGKLNVTYPVLKSAGGRLFLEQGLPDDTFSPNHTRATAAVLGATEGQSLVLMPGAEDWFEVKPPAYYLVTVREISAFPATGFQMEVYRDAEPTPRATSAEFNQRPVVTFTNTADPAARKYLRVVSPAGAVRRRYALEVTIAPPPPMQVRYGWHQVLGEHAMSGYALVTTRTDAVMTLEYGTDPAFNQFQSVQMIVTGQQYDYGGTEKTVPFQLTGLASDTVYYYRFVLDNGLTTVRNVNPAPSFRTAATAFTLDKTRVEFGLQKARTTKFLPVKLTNVGSSRWVLSRFVIEETWSPRSPWVVTHTCGTGLDPGKTCEVDIVFTPWYPGILSAMVWIESNSIRTGIVAVGEGSGGMAYVDNANGLDLNWQPAWVNHLSKEYRYVVRHWGNEPLTLQSFSATAPFTISRNECPAVLEIGSSCYFYVRFVPPKVGDNLGDLQVEHSGLDSPAVFRMMIWAQDLSLSVTRPRRPARNPGTGSATLDQEFTLLVSQAGASTGEVGLRCDVTTPGVSCDVSPPRLALAGGSATATVRARSTVRPQRLRSGASTQAVLKISATTHGVTKTIDVPVQIQR